MERIDMTAYVGQLEAELAAERQKVAELVEALKKYGCHDEDCQFLLKESLRLSTCSCGFRAVLAKNGGK